MKPQTAEQAKRLIAASGRAALLGVTLKRVSGDFIPELFILTKWQMTLQLSKIEEVEAWLDLLPGRGVYARNIGWYPGSTSR